MKRSGLAILECVYADVVAISRKAGEARPNGILRFGRFLDGYFTQGWNSFPRMKLSSRFFYSWITSFFCMSRQIQQLRTWENC